MVTGLMVAGLGVAFAVLARDRAGRIATVVSALAAVAAVGVAVWAALPGRRSGVVVRDTGKATATGGGVAVSGVRGAAVDTPGHIEVDHTGDAQANGGGDAVSGVSWT